MSLSFSEILKESAAAPGASLVAPKGLPVLQVDVPAPPHAGPALLDEVLKEVIGEIASEIQRIGEALRTKEAAPGKARPAAAEFELPAAPPAGPRLLEEALSSQERKVLSDILRESPPSFSLEASPPEEKKEEVDLPIGGFAVEPEEALARLPASEPQASSSPPMGDEIEAELKALAAMDAASPSSATLPASEGLGASDSDSGTWVSKDMPEVQQAFQVETDASMLEVEDLIKMHMQAEVVIDQRRASESSRAHLTAPGIGVFNVPARRLSLSERIDAWVVKKGLARYKRVAGILSWSIFAGTALGIAVTLWMRM